MVENVTLTTIKFSIIMGRTPHPSHVFIFINIYLSCFSLKKKKKKKRILNLDLEQHLSHFGVSLLNGFQISFAIERNIHVYS